MNDIAIIIPSRLAAERLPNKPLKLIGKKEMILHVYDSAKKANIGEVYVATPDEEILKKVLNYGGKAILTNKKHKTGTDRAFEVFRDHLNKKPKIIINLQGDMPNINFKDIINLANYMYKNLCDIGTLASKLNKKKEINDENVVKVLSSKNLINNKFSTAIDFFRKSTNVLNDNTYHHIGIYAFTNKALIRYVDLERSNLEIERNLEQMRAMENKMKIDVGLINSFPLSVDTEKDLIEIKKIMEKNE